MDEQNEELLRRGIIYVLKYLGSAQVQSSMGTLDYNGRLKITRECISTVANAALLNDHNDSGTETKNGNKHFRKLVEKGIVSPNIDMIVDGLEVLMNINIDCVKVQKKDTRVLLFNHKIENISFAANGGSRKVHKNCIGYVAKDDVRGRACYVFESIYGTSNMIMSSMSRTFNTKYKMISSKRRNDRESFAVLSRSTVNESVSIEPETVLSPFVSSISSTDAAKNEEDRNNNNNDMILNDKSSMQTHNNSPSSTSGKSLHSSTKSTNTTGSKADNPIGMADASNEVHHDERELEVTENLKYELWYHGVISRAKAEQILKNDGDFLVRKSSNMKNQYVLSGLYERKPKHLLLVDPDGTVRTKGHVFKNISSLIYYHQQRKISIVSPDSELLLENPVLRKTTISRTAD